MKKIQKLCLFFIKKILTNIFYIKVTNLTLILYKLTAESFIKWNIYIYQ
jgi:hypothetical protein